MNRKMRPVWVCAFLVMFAGLSRADGVLVEAESGRLSSGASVKNNHPDYSGSGFVEGFYLNSNATVSVELSSPKTGSQEITLRYAAGHGACRIVLGVNGVEQVVEMPGTASWSTWAFQPVSVPLAAGVNELSVRMEKKGRNCINLDYVALGRIEPPVVQLENQSPRMVEQAKNALARCGVEKLVVVVRNFIASSHNYTYFNEGFKPGGGLYVYENGNFRELADSSAGQILDCELSYDGTEALFSWKKDRASNYDIYRVKLDGTGLTQVTKHPANDFNVSWLPDGGIAFLSDRDNNYAYCMHSSSAVLYRMALDGSGLTRLSANYLSDIAPHVMNDGKIMYCRWEYVDRCQIPCQGLWAQNPDGTGLTHLFGGRMLTPVTISEAKSVPGTNKIIATLTGHNGAICGGIGVIDLSHGAHNPEGCSTILGEVVPFDKQNKRNENQKYEFPYPVNKDVFLVSNDGAVELSTFDGKTVTRLIDQDIGPAVGALGFYAALPVKAREREPVISSALPADPEPVGQLVMQDVYLGLEEELAAGLIERGEIKQIRVVEGLGKNNKGSQSQRAFCWQFPVVSAGATMEPKKTISVVDVEEDGSAMFDVPAMKPLLFQALDAEGRVIHRMRTFTQMMPGEIQSCTGCHLNRNSATPDSGGNVILALQKPIQKMNGAPWTEHASAFSYPEQVQPIWDRHCVQCHKPVKTSGGIDLSGDRTDLFNVSYDHLARTGANRNPSLTWTRPDAFPHTYVSYIPSYNGSEMPYLSEAYFKPKSWGAMKSKLADLVRSGHPNKKGEARVELTDLEKRTVYAWIDYNIPYYPTSFANHPKLPHGMRELVPEGFESTLADVAKRRCIECHSTPVETIGGWFSWNRKKKSGELLNNLDPSARNLPLDFYLRWEKPELNNFMLAPLAKSAGGTETCGMAVFEDTSDPDYQLLLRAFDEIHERVAKIPRMDMPGAKEIRSDKHSPLYECLEQP